VSGDKKTHTSITTHVNCLATAWFYLQLYYMKSLVVDVGVTSGVKVVLQ
jgi:hypothetical protein